MKPILILCSVFVSTLSLSAYADGLGDAGCTKAKHQLVALNTVTAPEREHGSHCQLHEKVHTAQTESGEEKPTPSLHAEPLTEGSRSPASVSSTDDSETTAAYPVQKGW